MLEKDLLRNSISTRKVLDFIQRQEQTTDLHEQFHSQVRNTQVWKGISQRMYSTISHVFVLLSLQLQRSADGFSVVAEYFGRGVFSKVLNRALIPSNW